MAGFRKIHWATFLLIVIFFLIWYGQYKKSQVGSPAGPNILFIAVDDLRPELPCYGVGEVHAPHIDRLASNGVLFNHAYAQMAVCNPSRISLLSGLRPDSTKIFDNTTHLRETLPGIATLPQWFRMNGYHTVGLGKIFHGMLNDTLSWSEPWWIPYDFQQNRGYVLPENKALAQVNRGRGAAFEYADTLDEAYPDGMIASKALAKMNELKEQQPFFLAVGFHKPHLPFAAPKSYWDLYDPASIKLSDLHHPPLGAPGFAATDWGELRAYPGIPKEGPVHDTMARKLIHGYRASISFMDAQIGKLLDRLQMLGLDENTIIVLWGDHGWKLGEYGDWCKHTNYEFDTRTVLIWSEAGLVGQGQTCDALVELIDIYPTLVDLSGLPAPEHLQGRSLAPFLNDPSLKGDPLAVSQYPRGQLMGYSYRTAQYRLIIWQDDDRNVMARELYDHVNDPHETRNIADIPGNDLIIKEILKLRP